MTPFLLSQILATCTLITGMVAFQLPERTHILRGWCLAALFAAAHFFVLGSVEAGVLILVTALRFMISSFTTDKRLMYLFMALAVGGFALTYQTPVSWLALAATLIGTWGSFYGTANAVRYSMMSTELIWVIHNLLVWSPVAVVMEVLFFTSNFIGWLRHRRVATSSL
ncbi:MAG: YgjV family protein [Gammaproteobacteria bacterium]